MKQVYAGVSLAVLAAMSASGAAAQTPADTDEPIILAANDAASGEAKDTAVDVVVVTAQRREQSAQDVGIALSVLSGAELTQRGVTNVNDLQNATPNLEIEPAFGGGAPQFRLRGVGFQDYASNNAPTVGVYVNEVAYPVPVMTQGLLFDIERVEVLRGPQGTLYGRNTTGGAINFITKRPTETPSFGATAEYSRFNQFNGEAYVSGPLSDRARGRIAVSTQQGGAWQHNRDTGESIGDANRSAIRGMLTVDPVEALTLTFEAHGGRDKSENQALYLFTDLVTRGGGPGSVLIPADTDRSATGWGLSPRFAASIGRDVDAKPGRDNTSWGTSLNGKLDMGNGLNLTSITSYESLDRSEYGDWDSSASVEADTFFGSDVTVFSQEVRLASDGGGPLNWVAGVYYSYQDLHEKYFSDFTDIFGTFGEVTYDQKVESISAFGQAEYQITPQLNLTGGLRYEEETRKLNGFGTAFGGATALPPTSVSTKMTPVTGKVALNYTPVDGLLVYGSFSRGAKSGGFTTYNTGQASAIQPFNPEILLAYEVGFKADPTQAFQLNGAAYYYDYSDQQVLSAIFGVNGPVGRFANVPKSAIWGGELEGTWLPVPGLRLTQSVSYKRGEYRKFVDLDVPASRAANTSVFVDRAGERIPFPAVSYGGSASYDWSVQGFNLNAEINYSYRSDYPSWLGTLYDVDSFWLANTSVSLAPSSGPWTVSLFVRNLFNEKYDLTRNFFTSANIAQPNRPRTYGVRLGVHY